MGLHCSHDLVALMMPCEAPMEGLDAMIRDNVKPHMYNYSRGHFCPKTCGCMPDMQNCTCPATTTTNTTTFMSTTATGTGTTQQETSAATMLDTPMMTGLLACACTLLLGFW